MTGRGLRDATDNVALLLAVEGKCANLQNMVNPWLREITACCWPGYYIPGSEQFTSFVFAKSVVSDGNAAAGQDEVEVNVDAMGTIELSSEIHRENSVESRSTKRVLHDRSSCAPVHEKAIEKQGLGIRMGTGDLVSKNLNFLDSSNFGVLGEIDQIGLTIMVRPEWWLRSRFIIDDDGQPCTAAKARTMIGQEARDASARRSLKFLEAFGKNAVIDLDGEKCGELGTLSNNDTTTPHESLEIRSSARGAAASSSLNAV